MKIMVLLWSASVAKDSSIVPSLFFSHLFNFFLGLLFFMAFLSFFAFPFFGLSFFIWPFSFFWDNALLMMIITLLFIYNSILEQDMTLYECLRWCTGMCNDSWVTCMKELWTVALPQILCQLHDHAKQYDNDERVMMNGMVESCMAIYLGMAMEMP